MGDEDLTWLFDAVLGFLKSPGWALPVMSFIDDNCIVFDSEDENKLAYMDIYTAFRDMVDSLLEMHLEELGVTGEQFAAVCEAAAQQQVGMEVLEQILAVDDFVSFKKMMVKRNMELELEAMKALQSLSARIAEEGSGSGGEQEEPGDDDFEAQLQQALELSMKEAQAAGTSTGINSADVDRQQAEAEEADLAMAIALSLQVEEEKEKQATAEAVAMAAARARSAAARARARARA
eukprot:CAMPEP_0118822418 /NCGR_PEP_ID=MMETSP1162-20130426/9172_1 /TAXON_ID=33656 /ORGANISM="Phaeocystis Sp, Strain CCMP2710" /LENGTH=234 /DNA_ID=CAMNT_0006752965 /DNA_START=170 /DNA_END=870 /DNA_ORIENTATION=+